MTKIEKKCFILFIKKNEKWCLLFKSCLKFIKNYYKKVWKKCSKTDEGDNFLVK